MHILPPDHIDYRRINSMADKPLSNCHQAPVLLCEGNRVDVDPESIRDGQTYWYSCSECKEPCDLNVKDLKAYVNLPDDEKQKVAEQAIKSANEQQRKVDSMADIRELKDKYVDWVSEEFPKGDKGRGKAAVLVGLMVAELEQLIKEREIQARQQMVDFYAREFKKGYENILPEEAVEGSISWLQKEADRIAELEGAVDKDY